MAIADDAASSLTLERGVQWIARGANPWDMASYKNYKAPERRQYLPGGLVLPFGAKRRFVDRYSLVRRVHDPGYRTDRPIWVSNLAITQATQRLMAILSAERRTPARTPRSPFLFPTVEKRRFHEELMRSGLHRGGVRLAPGSWVVGASAPRRDGHGVRTPDFDTSGAWNCLGEESSHYRCTFAYAYSANRRYLEIGEMVNLRRR